MNKRKQKKIVVYAITIFVIFIYIASLFIHCIIDRGKIKDTNSTEIIYPDNNVQGVEDENNNNNDGEIVDNKDRIRILQNGQTDWNELKELDIFNNNYFHDEAIIAPGVQGSYNYTIENISEKSCIYEIKYVPENKYNVNMMYKLKKNGKYIAGNENTWVTYDKMNVQNEVLTGNSKDIYTIEWKWIDTDYDTEIGETPGADYKMFISVYATEEEGV